MSRLASGGLIERSRRLSFTFDGKSYSGFEGDTLASALVANDVRLVGRSFKYHRPRGLLGAGSEEPNGLVTLRSGAHAEPNTRSTTAWLYDGLEATSQNRWPSLKYDFLSINQLFSPIFVAGFYYKTFMWPATMWEKLYEPLIRRAAGLGALSGLPDPDRYDKNHAFCDVLVIGGGPAGLAAALTAGRAGLRVILANEDALFGGRLLSERREIDGVDANDWARTIVAELESLPNVTLLPHTLVFGVFDGKEYGALERLTDHLPVAPCGMPRQRLWKIIAQHAVLASGALERPLVFGGNDRPGVMMASGVSTYINRFAASPGKRGVVFTTTDSGWQTAFDMVQAGINLTAVIDPRSALHPEAEMLRQAGVEVFNGAVVSDAYGSSLNMIEVRKQDGRVQKIRADLLAMSGGWNPSIGIASNLGSKPRWSEQINSFLIDVPPAGLRAVGSAAGHFSLAQALRDGVEAGRSIVVQEGKSPGASTEWRASDERIGMEPLWRVENAKKKAFVDFQHDVTDSDVSLAAREGFVSVEHLKRYTTLGMATDQGKTSQLNGHALLAAATGKSIAEAGTILSRPPYLPVAIGALAGHHRQANYRPERLTAAHQWAVEQDATFVEAGLWRRARWFARPGETHWRDTVSREVQEVRSRVGVVDVSTLGKIEVCGPDAGLFLDRLYINALSTLPVGKARYGVMLREDGIVMDDGTISRFAEDRYFLTTTTANAAKVMQHIDFARQVIWHELDVQAASVSEQWSTYAVAGPRSRELLSRVLTGQDISNDALPFMGVREFRWQGRPARIFRVSFSGELAYEISVVASLGEVLIRSLFMHGADLGVVPYGTEAQTVMRIEKGHAAGNELDGRTSAADLGLRKMMSKKKDFIGRALSERSALADIDRPTLVGVKPIGNFELPAGAHLMPLDVTPSPEHDQGWISSPAWSPTINAWIAVAFIKNGPNRIGERLALYDPVRGTTGKVEICSPAFVDPEGVRVRG
jgi:heterotetrameric sarcosine oxidase alpha subunit